MEITNINIFDNTKEKGIWFIHYSFNDMSIVLIPIQTKEVISCYLRLVI